MTKLKTLTVAAGLHGRNGAVGPGARAALHHVRRRSAPGRPGRDRRFQADNAEGVTVKMEAVEWGTCQDKSMQLAAAGDPPDVAYMGSRTLRQLGEERPDRSRHLHPRRRSRVTSPASVKTVSNGGQYWGIPHAFSTKALYINCAVVEAAGAECKAPARPGKKWSALAADRDRRPDAAGIGMAGKDFDNTMHMFLDFLYSNGGKVFDADGAPALDSQQTRETLQLYADLLPYMQSGPTEWERDQLRTCSTTARSRCM